MYVCMYICIYVYIYIYIYPKQKAMCPIRYIQSALSLMVTQALEKMVSVLSYASDEAIGRLVITGLSHSLQ